ncbi:MAG: S-adenosylmethionine:tRNA ribosyltransferase-isomerase [Pirellulaceae bacterium]|nr:MAG: S-adenosylmethionine:tRNA ribosyltransferase-isomerase [Pirellulaceae bacterium]
MERPEFYDLDHYDYELPRELIAQHPLANRADARLLVVDRSSGTWTDSHVRDLPHWLRPGDCLVVNDSRVVPARLVGRRDRTGGRWEGLFLEAEEHGFWRVLCKTRGKLEPGESITVRSYDGSRQLVLRLVARREAGEWVALPDESDRSPWELLEMVGRVPLPPYIRGGQMRPEDVQRYQTVYASQPGSVAAPTAGLHFTEELLTKIRARGVTVARVTLHVGVGTFRPIMTRRISEHKMHGEWGTISAETVAQIQQARQSGGRCVAVGTTVVRLLETAARSGQLQPWSGKTELYIHPPFTFYAVDCLMTNFHLPRSTLLVLVRTFGGDVLIRRAYEHAVAERYRFYSYGDAMLIL